MTLKELLDVYCHRKYMKWSASWNTIERLLNGLPSAQPRPRGKWIDEGFYADGHGAHAFRCSECGGHIIEYDPDPFCRWCGADMRPREEQDERH